jgi:hypothetical protein
LTNGQWNRTKKSYREKIEGIPSGIQIWDHKRLFGYNRANVKLKKQIASETFERLRNRASEVTELNQLAKLLGNTSAGFSTEDFTKLNITKSINLQIGPSEMKSMTPKRAKAIARAIELSLILKKNREENTDD